MILPEKVEKQFEVAVVEIDTVELDQVICAGALPVRGHDLAERCHVGDQQPQEVQKIAQDVCGQESDGCSEMVMIFAIQVHKSSW